MTAGPVTALPAELLPLSWLVGHWAGVGLGQYPGIDDFRFGQELTISWDGQPFLWHSSRSWLLDDAGDRVRPLAAETGFWRPRPDNGAELLLAHPTGYAEVWYGQVTVTAMETARISGARIHLQSDVVARTASAKPYGGGERLYGLVGDELLWTFDMAAGDRPLGNHLAARLRSVVA